MFALTSETIRILRDSGWSESRNEDPSQLLAMVADFVPNDRIAAILSSFGGLTIIPLRDGTQVFASEKLEFVPDPLGCASDWGLERAAILDADAIFPLASWGPSVVYIDSRDRVFCELVEQIDLVGETFEEGLETLLLARRPLRPWVSILPAREELPRW